MAPNVETMPTPGPSSAAETWRLQHPTLGALEVITGTLEQLSSLDPEFPAEDIPEHRSVMLFRREGRSIARVDGLRDMTFNAEGEPLTEESKPIANQHQFTGARVKVTVGGWRADTVRTVRFKDDDGALADFDPPAGSAAEARLAKIAASPWRRVVYPIGGGMGKAGWALLVLVLGPLIARLIGALIPDVEVDIPVPSLPLPEFTFPEINIPAPNISLPQWLEPILEYSKFWVPVLLGVLAAAAAVRAARRSRRTREAWEKRRP
ncbi:hypothetical protein GCM10009771_17820 [Nesterenkonia flava]